uniref:Uncharacterized protein n=1 Tax=Anguilla anguilla TaxID=7936 RepID=A0A0E9VRJ9_ANGAN
MQSLLSTAGCGMSQWQQLRADMAGQIH